MFKIFSIIDGFLVSLPLFAISALFGFGAVSAVASSLVFGLIFLSLSVIFAVLAVTLAYASID